MAIRSPRRSSGADQPGAFRDGRCRGAARGVRGHAGPAGAHDVRGRGVDHGGAVRPGGRFPGAARSPWEYAACQLVRADPEFWRASAAGHHRPRPGAGGAVGHRRFAADDEGRRLVMWTLCFYRERPTTTRTPSRSMACTRSWISTTWPWSGWRTSAWCRCRRTRGLRRGRVGRSR